MGTTLILDDNVHYEFLGTGCEGTVFAYDELTAFKTFFSFQTPEERNLKLYKIEALGKLSDPSFLFPLGFTRYSNKPKEGYYMKRVYKNKEYSNVALLKLLKDMRLKFGILIEVDAAVRRAHKVGIRIGDLRGGNILVDREDKPLFCDTDNYVYDDMGFDLKPDRVRWLENFYKRKLDLMDVDKFFLAVVAIDTMFKYLDVYENLSPEFLRDLVEKLNVSREIKNGLLEIFSDSENKPYVGDILRELNPDEKILSLPKTLLLNVKHRV